VRPAELVPWGASSTSRACGLPGSLPGSGLAGGMDADEIPMALMLEAADSGVVDADDPAQRPRVWSFPVVFCTGMEERHLPSHMRALGETVHPGPSLEGGAAPGLRGDHQSPRTGCTSRGDDRALWVGFAGGSTTRRRVSLMRFLPSWSTGNAPRHNRHEAVVHSRGSDPGWPAQGCDRRATAR